MLGSKLFNEFIKLKRLIVRGSSRSLPKIFNDDRRNIDLNCDVYNLDLIYKNLKKFNPDIIINCIGVVKQKIKKPVPITQVLISL